MSLKSSHPGEKTGNSRRWQSQSRQKRCRTVALYWVALLNTECPKRAGSSQTTASGWASVASALRAPHIRPSPSHPFRHSRAGGNTPRVRNVATALYKRSRLIRWFILIHFSNNESTTYSAQQLLPLRIVSPAQRTGLIETQLSPAAVAELKLDTLKMQKGSFVDADLREKFSDLLFSVELAHAPEDSANRKALVYFLFEHKSQSDPLTVLQVLSYMVRIWEKRIRDGEPLCPIVPLLVYHGETAWAAARSLAALIPAPAALAEHQIHFQPPLLDLSCKEDAEIQGEPVLRNTLLLLKYSRSRHLVEKLGEILDLICRSVPAASFVEWVQAIGVYVMTVNKNIDGEQYKQTLSSILPTQFEPGSLADRLLIQGREEGREEGEKIGELVGKVQLLEELLGAKVTSKSDLLASDPETLRNRVISLQAELRKRTN